MINAGIFTKEEFEENVKNKEVCVVDFSASWCGPCRMLAPVIEDVAEKFKDKYYFYNIDVDSADDIAAEFRISAVPTIVILNNGKEIARTSGFMDADELELFITNNI